MGLWERGCSWDLAQGSSLDSLGSRAPLLSHLSGFLDTFKVKVANSWAAWRRGLAPPQGRGCCQEERLAWFRWQTGIVALGRAKRRAGRGWGAALSPAWYSDVG